MSDRIILAGRRAVSCLQAAHVLVTEKEFTEIERAAEIGIIRGRGNGLIKKMALAYLRMERVRQEERLMAELNKLDSLDYASGSAKGTDASPQVTNTSAAAGTAASTRTKPASKAS